MFCFGTLFFANGATAISMIIERPAFCQQGPKRQHTMHIAIVFFPFFVEAVLGVTDLLSPAIAGLSAG